MGNCSALNNDTILPTTKLCSIIMNTSHTSRYLLRQLNRPCSHIHRWQAASSRPSSIARPLTRSYRTEPNPPPRDPPSKAERKPTPHIRVSPSKREPLILRPAKDVYEQAPNPSAPSPEAIRAAEVREAKLRAARSRRADQRQEEVAERLERERRKEKRQEEGRVKKRIAYSFMIGMPVIVVLGYHLYDRSKCVRGWEGR